MIDRVRKTVLTLLNKDNRGTLPPAEFNRLTGLAQRSIFEDNFYHYNRYVNMQNKRMTNSEYSDIPKNIREKIDLFSVFEPMNFNEASSTTEDLINYETYFDLDVDDLYRVIGLQTGSDYIEEVPKSIALDLMKDVNTKPNLTYPVYFRTGNKFVVLPQTIESGVTANYIRTPKQPKWTYTTFQSNPIFNPSDSTYQDIELHPSDEARLIVKVLGYCGVTIREQEVYQVSTNEEVKKDNKEQ